MRMDTWRTLELMMRNDYWISKTSFWVYARNGMPNCNRPGLHIISASDHPEEHWILIHVNNDCNAYVYDSLGTGQEYAMKIGSAFRGQPQNMFSKRIQGGDTTVCRGYALYFAREIAKGCSPTDPLLARFESRCAAFNDAYIRSYISKNFRTLISMY